MGHAKSPGFVYKDNPPDFSSEGYLVLWRLGGHDPIYIRVLDPLALRPQFLLGLLFLVGENGNLVPSHLEVTLPSRC